MRKLLIIAFLSLLPISTFANTYIEKKLGGHLFKVIKYDLSSDNYEIKVIKTDDATNLKNLLEENNAMTGVNGVFFCPTDYAWCNTTKSFTDNERYIKGEKYAKYLTTGDRAVFGWTKDKVPFIYQSGKINMDDQDKIYYGLGNYPLLVSEGKNMLEEYWDKGLIDNKMKAKGTRNFICSDKDKSNIYFGLVYDATIDELANALIAFGCNDALNLDAGLSTAFIYNNRYLVGPQRNILDAVAIERKGLDIKEINKISNDITEIIVKDSIKKSRNDTDKLISKIDNYINALNSFRINYYQKFLIPIEEENIVGEIDEVGYKIEINELKPLKLITTINSVTQNLKETRQEIIDIKAKKIINEIKNELKDVNNTNN